MVEAADWSAFQGILERLQEKGFRPSRTPHRLTFAGEVSLDLLPYGAGIIEGNRLKWRDTEQVMSAVGFEETFQNAATVEIAPGLSVLVAAIPSLVLLKIAAYTDRPRERARDLLDMLYCFEHYAAEQDRRFVLAGRLVDGEDLRYEECGAYLLGRDVVSVATPESLVRAREFVGIFDSEYSTPIGQILREEKRLEESGRRTSLFRLFRVFGRAVIS
jgi:predicted nucleotidyltransferase